MTQNQLNRLPVPTWNRCGVNYAPDAAALPAVPEGGFGAEVLSLTVPEGVQEAEGGFDAFPESGMGAAADTFWDENAALRRLLTVEPNRTLTEPIVMEAALSEAAPTAASSISLSVGKNSSVILIEVVRGDAENGVSGSLTRIRAADGAQVRLIQVQLLGKHARRWNAVAIDAGRGARVEQVRVELGGSVTACGTRVLLGGQQSAFRLDAIYFGRGNAVLDFNDVSVHTGRDTLCEMRTAGVLMEHADKILRGTIDFRRGAKRGVGHESEDVLLFSPEARNRTAPLILCGEEEVEGQHAASVGRLDEAKLYYLRSRGLTEEQAQRLMVDARFAPAIDKLPGEALQEEVRAETARRLDDSE